MQLLKANICKLSPYVHFGKGDFSNLVSQAPLKQPHKATTNKFLLLNATSILQNYAFPKGLVEPFILTKSFNPTLQEFYAYLCPRDAKKEKKKKRNPVSVLNVTIECLKHLTE